MRTMIRYCLLVAIGCCSLFTPARGLAQDIYFDWARAMIAPNWGGGTGNSVFTDEWGNVYTTGSFTYTVDFDPGPGVFNLTADGGGDIFVSKLDVNGNFVWAKSIGGGNGGPHNQTDAGNSIYVDGSGNIYVTGYFQDMLDFDPGPGTFLMSAPNYNRSIFVLKLDNNGDFIWAKDIDGIEFSGYRPYGESVKADVMGNVYVTGGFAHTLDFNPGAGIYNLSSAGGYDVFLMKLDAAGNFLWAKNVGGESDDYVYSLELSSAGDPVVSGGFSGNADFDPGPGIYNPTAQAGTDAYVLKLNAAGNFVWVKTWGGTGNVVARIRLDAQDNIYAGGGFMGTVDFDPGAGVFNLTALSGSFGSAYLSKLNASGGLLWAKRWGNPSSGVGVSDIDIDIKGNVYAAGVFWDSADFDPGPSVFTLYTTPGGPFPSPTAVNTDIYITKLNTSGDFQWAKGGMGGPYADGIFSVDADERGNHVHTTGGFQGSMDFDPGPGMYYLNSSANIAGNAMSPYVHKLSCDNDTSITIAECDHFTLDTVIYSQSGIYRQIFTNVNGCDSVVTLNLTILPAPDPTLSSNSPVCAGNSFTVTVTGTLPGTSYSWSGPAGFSAAEAGISIGNMQVVNAGAYILNTTGTNGCFSSDTILVTVSPMQSYPATAVICAYDHYIFGVESLSEAGAYSHVFKTAGGCDSLSMLNLVVLPAPAVSIMADQKEQLCRGDSVSLSASGASNYHWYRDGEAIGNMADLAFALPDLFNTVTVVGIAANECADTATLTLQPQPCCHLMVPNAFSPNGDGLNDIFKAETNGHFLKYQLSVYNRWGQRVFSSFDVRNGWNGIINGLPADAGTYHYYISSECLEGGALLKKGDVLLIR